MQDDWLLFVAGHTIYHERQAYSVNAKLPNIIGFHI